MQHFLPHVLKSSASAIDVLHISHRLITSISRLGTEHNARVFSPWDGRRDSWSSGPYSTSQRLSCPNKQTLKTPQTSRVHSSCGLNTPSLQTHTGFIIAKSPAAVCSSLLHLSRVNNVFLTASWLHTTFPTSFMDAVHVYRAIYVLFTEKRCLQQLIL